VVFKGEEMREKKEVGISRGNASGYLCCSGIEGECCLVDDFVSERVENGGLDN
jgi:hypothetical protein